MTRVAHILYFVLFGILIVAMLLLLLNFKIFWLATLFLIVYISLSIYFLGINDLIYIQLEKPQYYLKLLTGLCSFSFVIISIVFGFHTDLLVKFDKSISIEDNNWLNPISILEFPELNFLKSKEDFIDNISLKSDNIKNDSIIHIIFIDVTKSISKSKIPRSILQEINKDLISEIEPVEYNKGLPIFLIDRISKKNKSSKIVIYNYIGDSTFRSTQFFDQNDILCCSDYCISENGVKNRVINAILNPNNNSNLSKTNIKSFLAVDRFLNKFDKKQNLKIYFISDFLDECDNHELKISNEITNFNSILSVGLIKIEGKNSNSTSVFDQIKCDEKIEKMTIKNTINFSQSPESIHEQLHCLLGNDNLKYKDQSNLNFTYPHKLGQNYTSVQCKFKIVDTIKDSDFYFKMEFPDRINENYFWSLYKNDEKFSIESFSSNKPIKINNVKNSDIFKIQIDNVSDIESSRLYLDISNNGVIKNFNLNFTPLLSPSNIYTLVVFYSLILFSITLLFNYIYLIASKLKMNRSNSINSHKYLFYFMIFLNSLLPIYYIYMSFYSDLFLIKIILLIIIFLLTLKHFLVHYFSIDGKT